MLLAKEIWYVIAKVQIFLKTFNFDLLVLQPLELQGCIVSHLNKEKLLFALKEHDITFKVFFKSKITLTFIVLKYYQRTLTISMIR